jgi:cobalt transporter subunit CbtA
MAVFRRLVFVALCAGLLSGVFATAAPQIGTVPLILEAETYEQPAATAWEPDNGTERALYTLLADVLTGIGFALLLSAGLTLRGGEVTWREGLFWGLAGFASVILAPGLGLPPQLPGNTAAPLFERQLWWLGTAVSTGCALALLVFTGRAALAILATALIVLPHLYGAPQPLEHGATTPEALSHRFVVAATVANFLFWVVLGASTGYFCGRMRLRVLS